MLTKTISNLDDIPDLKTGSAHVIIIKMLMKKLSINLLN